MQNSRIEWTDHTFNPWIGCQKVSPGCKNCYAETYGNRFGVQWGPQGERRRTSSANWRKPLAWNNAPFVQCDTCGWRGSKRGMAYCLACHGSTCTPTRQRVFCASLADVFEDRPELVPWRAELFEIIANTPNLDWLLLTKRPEHIRRVWPWTPTVERPNIWLGTSVENQEQANKRIPELLLSPGSVRFLSCEPLLGPVDLTAIRRPPGFGPAIDWVIVGGESGPHARPMHPDWARSLRDQCVSANVPFFFKQWGEYIPFGQWDASGQDVSDHAVQGFDDVGLPNFSPHTSMFARERTWAWKVGKHVAGRYLDERIHNSHPHSPRG